MKRVAMAGVLWAAAAWGQDGSLDALHATLVKLHAQKDVDYPERGRGPDLTTAKHQLIGWVETQLLGLKQDDDLKGLVTTLNQALDSVSLPPAGDGQSLLGEAGVHLNKEDGLLIVKTEVGILCQDDVSIYGYEMKNGHWRRVFESERNDYSEEGDLPLASADVHVARHWDGKDFDDKRYILVMGNEWGCASFWHAVEFEIWRADSSGSKQLLREMDLAYFRSGSSFIVGSIGQNRLEDGPSMEALVEYATGSIDAGVHNREAVRKYEITGDTVKRVAPLALSPRDFVDEWIRHGWDEMAAWTDSPALQREHNRLYSDHVAGEFDSPTKHCLTPDLWQVAIALGSDDAPDTYFLVRWRPPYRFTMVDVSDKPRAECNEADPEADKWRTLFNTQDWRN